MVTIEQIKTIIIKQETEWLEEIHDEDEASVYVLGMVDEVRECDTIDDILNFYVNRGMDMYEAVDVIVSLLRDNCVIKE